MSSGSDIISKSASIHSEIEESSYSSESTRKDGRTWSQRNPRTCVGLKITAIITAVLLIIAFFVAVGVTGGFVDPNGWWQHTAMPAMRDFFNKKLDLTVGEGLSYIAAPILGLGIISGISYKYIRPAIQMAFRQHKAEVKAQKAEQAAAELAEKAAATILEDYKDAPLVDGDKLLSSSEED